MVSSLLDLSYWTQNSANGHCAVTVLDAWTFKENILYLTSVTHKYLAEIQTLLSRIDIHPISFRKSQNVDILRKGEKRNSIFLAKSYSNSASIQLLDFKEIMASISVTEIFFFFGSFWCCILFWTVAIICHFECKSKSLYYKKF